MRNVIIKTMMIVLFVLLGAIAFMAIKSYQHTTQRNQPTAQVAKQPLTPTLEFISLCSNIDATNIDVKPIAVANCLGRTRGFSDGHLITSKLVQNDQRNTNPPANIQLWCIDEHLTDGQVFESVVGWVEENADQFHQMVNQYDKSTVAVAVMIAALHKEFPCEK